MNSDYRSFFLANHPGKFRHVFTSLEDQLRDGPCWACSNGGKSCDRAHGSLDALVTGSPCDPFSVQRSKRFAQGSVKTHEDFETTMRSVTEAYGKYEPVIGIMEQVMGFLLPMEAGSEETPFARYGCQMVFHLHMLFRYHE